MAELHPMDGLKPGLVARLRRTRSVVRGVILVERLWPILLPLVVIAALFLSLSWFGVFRILPDWARLGVLGLLGVGAVASLWPVRKFRAPTAAEVDRRIEQANLLEHAPVSVQSDRLAAQGDDPFAAALWREHQKRMAERLSRLQGDLPQTSIPERDPFGLRAVAALLFVTALAYSTGPYGGRIADAFQPPASGQGVSARIDAWVTPPAYTGRAPVFLTADANRAQQAFTVPQNSIIAVRVSGGSGEEALAFTDAAGAEQAIPAEEAAGQDAASAATAEASSGGGSIRFSHILASDGAVSLRDGRREVQNWQFSVTPDTPPQIRFTEEPKRAANGALELVYEIEDDYGALDAAAAFVQAEADPQARPLFEAPEMPLSLPRGGDRIEAKTSRDLTEHPWAGSDVNLTLSATDGAKQTARSETKTFRLPERLFTNPLARALVEQRRVLALDANQQRRVGALMDAVLLWPEETFDNDTHFLLISAARSRLAMANDDDALREVANQLWEIALIIEDGDMTAAEKRLRQAQQELKQALENGASDEEIERLMSELRQAMQEFLREFAERAMQNQQFSENPDSQMLSQNDLERMLDQLEDLAKSGAREQAQDLLSQLENMMNNLQMAQPQQGGQGGQQSEMRQQMDQLGEIIRRQQELMNETFRLDQQQGGQQGEGQQGQQGQGQFGQGQQPGQGQGRQPGQGQGQGMSPEALAEALRDLQEGQGSLRENLQNLMEGLRGLGIQPGEGFGQAGEAMGEAQGALGQGEGERALGEQGRALEALRRGAQDMMNQMQAMQGEQGGQGQGQGRRAGNFSRDPLGRPTSRNGGFDEANQEEMVPEVLDAQRAREVLDAIRRRLGNALSPQLEREYLERLLDMR